MPIIMPMHAFLTPMLTILLSYGSEDTISPIECELNSCETSFTTNIEVKASISYPHLSETGPLVHYVNETVQKEASELYSSFVKVMSIPQKELWEEDGDERILCYDLNLVHFAPTLISFYGSKFQYTGGAHGSVQYITKTFWQENNTIGELSLDDLFLPGSREWLFRYCEDYFKSNRCGYYSYDEDDYSWIGFNAQDLEGLSSDRKRPSSSFSELCCERI